MSSDKLLTNRPQAKPTDSAWFWASVFLCGAAVALLLSEPKYSWRQPQIERQYQARQRSGVTIAAPDDPTELSQTGKPTIVSLRPLKIGIVLAILITSIWFWTWRALSWRAWQRRTSSAESESRTAR